MAELGMNDIASSGGNRKVCVQTEGDSKQHKKKNEVISFFSPPRSLI